LHYYDRRLRSETTVWVEGVGAWGDGAQEPLFSAPTHPCSQPRMRSTHCRIGPYG